MAVFGGGGHSAAMNASLMNMLLNDPYAKAEYEANLKQWLKDNESDLVAKDSQSLIDHMGPVLQQMASRPGMSQGQLDSLAMVQALINTGAVTDDMLKAATKASTDLSNHYSGEMFDRPATLTIAEEIMKADPTISRKDAILMAGKIETPELLRQKETIKSDANIETDRAKRENEEILNKQKGMTASIYGYDQAIKNSTNVLSKLDRIEKYISDNPNATGWADIVKVLPESDQMALADLIATVNDNNVLTALGMAKEASPTGSSGMGPITEKEGERLGNQIAKLNQRSTTKEILSAVNDMRGFYDERRRWAHEAWKADSDWNNSLKDKYPNVWRESKPAPEFSDWATTRAATARAEKIRRLQELEGR